MSIQRPKGAAGCLLIAGILLLCAERTFSQVSVIGELSQDREARPGESYNGSILVKNDSDEPQEAKVYQTDYLFFSDGTNNYAEPGSTPRSNARWVSYSPSLLLIPPQATVTVNYSVAVPDTTGGKTLTGSYWSMLMVEGIAKESPESSVRAKSKNPEMGVRQTLRYGIQIATHIAGSGTRSIKFVSAKLVRGSRGETSLQVDLEDDGTLGFRPDVYVELFDGKGISKGKFPGHRYRMYPGTSVRQMIELSGIAKGTYKALVVVDAGGDDVYGAQYTLDF
ncbi:MAG TPA: hypothetical protein VMF59_02355 [Bacteroidota bacterium]|nr:hypothetical protein [Bacteroidota bacterium]